MKIVIDSWLSKISKSLNKFYVARIRTVSSSACPKFKKGMMRDIFKALACSPVYFKHIPLINLATLYNNSLVISLTLYNLLRLSLRVMENTILWFSTLASS